MKFSILVPVYNVEKHLIECLESILLQTFKDYELILVDDGSTDSSGKICDEYSSKHKHIKVIHQKNYGLLCARRIGIANAQGDYSLFIDSDDFVDSNLLQTLAETIYKHADIDLILYSFRYIQDGKPDKCFHPIADNGTIWEDHQKHELYDKLLFSNDISPIWIKAVKTALLKNDKTDYSIYYGKDMAEDVLQSLYILTESSKIIYLDKPLYNYRVQTKSMSHLFHPSNLKKKNILHVYEKELEYLKIWNMNTTDNRFKLIACYFKYAMWTFIHCYEAANTLKETEEVVKADWESLIPKLNIETIIHYITPTDYYLYCQIKKKNYFALNMFFLKRKSYKIWKRIKSYCFGHINSDEKKCNS